MRSLMTSLFLIMSLFLAPLFAQSFNCGTTPPTPEERQLLKRNIYDQAFANDRNDGTTCIPIRVVVVRQSDGSGGVSDTELTQGLAALNAYYLSAGIEFFYCGSVTYYNDDNLYDYDSSEEGDLVAATGQVSDAVNVYCVGTISVGAGQAAGYAYLPYNNNPVYNRILMTASGVTNSPNGTYVHEFGHYFSLLHTHDGTEDGNTDPYAENVPRSGSNANCSSAGDYLCDTEADPRYSGGNFNFGTCTYTGSQTDQYGNIYDPPVNNIMSYYPDQCGGIFTSGQYGFIQSGLATRQSFGTYDFSCAPASVNVPTGVTAALSADESLINLSWTDNASNELGYLIEYSTTSASSGFQQATGLFTGPDITGFNIYGFSPATTYWFRIKPANGACNTYSNVASVTTSYCGANSQTCDEYISRVQIGSIDNSTGCTSGGFGIYTGQSTTVEIGTSYPLTVTNGLAYENDVCGVWVDWNHDKDFDDANESIAVTGGTSVFNATITPPIGALTGSTRMRIRITWNTTPSSCGTPQFGEVEDYTLDVTENALPVELTTFAARQENNAVNLHWETKTELNNDYFEVERSRDNRTYTSIGKRWGQGTTVEPQYYTLPDRVPLIGTNYYRLRQVDFDGSVTYSDVISVDFTSNEQWSLQPNPATDQIRVIAPMGLSEQTQFVVYNAAGQQQLLDAPNWLDNRGITFDCLALPEGVYWLKITGPFGSSSIKFMKL